MSLQQLLAQIQQTGWTGAPGQNLEGMDLFGITGGDVATQLGGQYGLDAGTLSGGMFQGISPDLVKSASLGAYSPLFQQNQSNMASQLMQQLGGQQTRKAYGGFAGSGGANMAQQQARDVYGRGMQDTLTTAMGGKTQSLGQIQDIINQWHQTAQSFTQQG